MHTPSSPAPRGSPVPGVAPEPVRVVDDTLGGTATGRRRHGDGTRPPACSPGLLRVIRGDKHMAGACAPTRHAAPPARAEVARPDVRGNAPTGVHPAGELDVTSGPRTGSQTKEG